MTSAAYDVIVIGSGVAGLNAAKHSAQAGFSTANIECGLFGGLIANVNELDGLPDAQAMSGYRLASRLKLELMKLGVSAISATVTGISADGGQIRVETDGGGQYGARAVVVASGSRLKRLGVPGEAEYLHRGVSLCADCDGPLYRDQDVVVVGGGDSAVQAALTLSKQSRRVNVIHHGPAYSAQPHLVEAAAGRSNITPLWNSTVEEIVGDQGVTGVRVGGNSAQINCTGVFAYIGLEPNSEFAPAEIERDEFGYLKTDAALQTSVPGIFAAGAVRAGHGGLVIHAMADAELAVAGIKRHLR
jgi:thioredoxin reductase (NADPH)